MQSLKYKILSAFLVVISVLVIAEIFFVAVHFLTIRRYQAITENMVSEYQIVEKTTNLIASFNNLVKYANYAERSDEYQSDRASLVALLARLDKTIVNPDSQIAYLGLKNTVQTVLGYCDSGVKSVSQGNLADVTDDYSQANHQNLFVQQNTASLILKELQYTEKLQADISRDQLISEIVGSALFILVLIGCLWYSFAFSHQLISPLAKLTKLAKKIEEGNLDAVVEADLLSGSDEVASLAKSFSTMVASLRANIKQLQEYNQALIKTKKAVVDRETRISQLQEVNQMKDEFVNIVTHELKTPLIPIVGLSEVMGQRKEELPPEFQGYINIIHEEALKLTGLIKQILTATRSKLANGEKIFETFKVDEFILGQALSLNELAKRTGSRIEFQVAEKDISLESDKERLSQIVYNLVDNAVKYGPSGQNITISIKRPDNNSVRVDVIDQGQGIPRERQDLLFQKFSQLEPSASRSREGMGLGLYICKQNAEYLNGLIGVESEAGRGSDFYFILPLKPGKKISGNKIQSGNPAAKPGQKKISKRRKSASAPIIQA